MTRAQRRAHGVGAVVLVLALVALAGHALLSRRAAWAEAEAIREVRGSTAASGGADER